MIESDWLNSFYRTPLGEPYKPYRDELDTKGNLRENAFMNGFAATPDMSIHDWAYKTKFAPNHFHTNSMLAEDVYLDEVIKAIDKNTKAIQHLEYKLIDSMAIFNRLEKGQRGLIRRLIEWLF